MQIALQVAFLFFVGAPGFEPGTPCSQSRCATGLRYAPKIVPVFFGWRMHQDLNLRPSRFHRDALPGCATPRRLGAGVGVGVRVCVSLQR